MLAAVLSNTAVNRCTAAYRCAIEFRQVCPEKVCQAEGLLPMDFDRGCRGRNLLTDYTSFLKKTIILPEPKFS